MGSETDSGTSRLRMCLTRSVPSQVLDSAAQVQSPPRLPRPVDSQWSRPALNADVFFMATQYVLSVKKTSVSGVAALKALEWSR